jgi:hypothetical protein
MLEREIGKKNFFALAYACEIKKLEMISFWHVVILRSVSQNIYNPIKNKKSGSIF